MIVAIDGPAGTGKGTITKIVGQKLNLTIIDTGAMYRCVALACLRKNIEPTEIEKIDEVLKDINIEFRNENGKTKTYLNGKDVTNDIRTLEVDKCVAKFAALKNVRDKMTPLQRKMGQMSNIIMEGRDIGTVVFPDADIKIFLDCSIEERAKRRYEQDLRNGIEVTYEEVLEGIKERHKLETEREIAPLVKADDAIYLDNTNWQIDETVAHIVDIIEKKSIEARN